MISNRPVLIFEDKETKLSVFYDPSPIVESDKKYLMVHEVKEIKESKRGIYLSQEQIEKLKAFIEKEFLNID